MSTLEEKVSGMRINYDVSNIDEDNLPSKDPFEWFKIWFQKAVEHPGVIEANAMTVATASREGIPSARLLLLKGFSKEGFQFFTNHGSQKGKELAENPHAALIFYWEALQLQIRISGRVERLTEEESTKYFHIRPFESQISAAASPQTVVLPNLKYLEGQRTALREKYDGKIVPKPDYWGGYIVKPSIFEFWCGGAARKHDRLRFRKLNDGEVIDETLTKKGEGDWVYEILSP